MLDLGVDGNEKEDRNTKRSNTTTRMTTAAHRTVVIILLLMNFYIYRYKYIYTRNVLFIACIQSALQALEEPRASVTR